MATRNLPEMPNAPILELYGQRKRFHVPFGMKPLLESMSREVIKAQPENIYSYLASFLEERARQKANDKAQEEYNKTHRKSWMDHHWSFQASSVLSPQELDEFLQYLRTSQADANRCAVIIQKVYRGHHAREIVKIIRKSRLIELGLLHLAEDEDDKTEGETEVDELAQPIDEHIMTEEDMHKPMNGDAHDWIGTEEDNEHDVNHEMEHEEEESDLDSRTYEIEDDDEEPHGFGTTDEEQEESIPDVEPEIHTPPEHEEQHQNEQELITILAPVPDHENKMDPDSHQALPTATQSENVEEEEHHED